MPICSPTACQDVFVAPTTNMSPAGPPKPRGITHAQGGGAGCLVHARAAAEGGERDRGVIHQALADAGEARQHRNADVAQMAAGPMPARSRCAGEWMAPDEG